MPLDATNRTRVGNQLMRASGWPGITKADLRAAVDATDDWIESNQTSFNNALPQPFRGAASLVLKTLLFAYVAFRRAGLLKAEED